MCAMSRDGSRSVTACMGGGRVTLAEAACAQGRFLMCPIPAERRVLIHACVESRLLHAALACQNLVTLAGHPFEGVNEYST